MRIANETRELLNQCCVEFVRHLSREAQQISSRDQRKTIYHDHVQKALKNLGFPREYVDAANSVLGECKMAAEKRLKRKNSRLDKCGIPEEQLWQIQQQLIEKARREEAEKEAANIGASSLPYAGDHFYPMLPPSGLPSVHLPCSASSQPFAFPPPSGSTNVVDPNLERMFIQQGRLDHSHEENSVKNEQIDREDADEEDYDV